MAPEDDAARGHVERGLVHLNAREFDEAIRCFDEALRLEPGSADARLGRGLCWHHLGEIENAK